MSKKRQARFQSPKYTLSTTFDRSLRNASNPEIIDKNPIYLSRSFIKGELSKSMYTPKSLRNDDKNKSNLDSFYRQKLFNRNISTYRDSIIKVNDDTSQLPFMSSLRTYGKINSVDASDKSSKPFNTAFKTTMNQKFRKRIRDFEGCQKTMSNSFNQWHNKSGLGTKICTQFESMLRQDYFKSIPGKNQFQNTIRPINYDDTDHPQYEISSLICPKQRKIFKMKA